MPDCSAALLLNLSPVFAVTTGTWVLPDGPLVCALLGAALCLLHALPAQGRTGTWWWLAAGLCAGLALFSKYSAVLSIAGALLYLLSSRRHRRWLARPQPYLAALARAAGVLPGAVLERDAWLDLVRVPGRAAPAARSLARSRR